MYRLALGKRAQADAEDVYQDVFMRLYGSATEFTSSEHLKA
ncbi:MAG: sigma factor [Eggerthellaceae bacterium]